MVNAVSIAMLCVMYVVPTEANGNTEYEHIPIDGFDQSEDSLEQWFMWLPMDTYNKQTYHDVLTSDFSRAFHELIIPFDVGVVSESEAQKVVSKNNLPNELCKVYYLNEIQQTFNATYSTNIDMASLDDLTIDGQVLVKIIDNYFVVIQYPHGTDVNPNPKGGCKIGSNSYYWIWYYQDEWNTNDLIYTIISYKNIAGYDVRTIDYIGYEPPSDKLLSQYRQKEITVTLMI